MSKIYHCRVIHIWATVRHLATIFDVKFTFPLSGRRHHFSTLPEIRLASLLVIAVKLYHPFDSLKRRAKTLTEPGVLTIDWDNWCQAQSCQYSRSIASGDLNSGCKSSQEFERHSWIDITEEDVFNMSGPQLDQYLDWYEKTWIGGETRRRNSAGLPQQLLDMFPTERPVEPTLSVREIDSHSNAEELATQKRLQAVQGSLKMRGVVLEESEATRADPVRRIGSDYKIYRREEDLPPIAKVFYEVLARLIGLSLHRLVYAVFQTETKLLFGRDEQQRRESNNGGMGSSNPEEIPPVNEQGSSADGSQDESL